MTNSRPRIAITAGSNPGTTDHAWLRFDYLEAILKAGGLPFIIAAGFGDPFERREGLVGEILDGCDGLLLSGGEDIDPLLFGETPSPRLGRVDAPRDPFEIALLREAIRRDLPVFGICRGLQVLNVTLGGTLIQDIPSELPEAARHTTGSDRLAIAHEVDITPDSCLAGLLSPGRIGVNSFHHQAIKRLGDDLVITAVSPDDEVIEAVEMKERTFVVAVQWHPENFWKTPAFDGLFSGFVAAARAKRRG